MSAEKNVYADDGNYFYYDEDWNYCSAEESFYAHTLLQITISTTATLSRGGRSLSCRQSLL